MEVKKSPPPKKNNEGLEKKPDNTQGGNSLYLETKYLSEILKDLGVNDISKLHELDIKSKKNLEKKFNHRIKNEGKVLSKKKIEIDRLIQLFKKNLKKQRELYDFSKKTAKGGGVKSVFTSSKHLFKALETHEPATEPSKYKDILDGYRIFKDKATEEHWVRQCKTILDSALYSDLIMGGDNKSGFIQLQNRWISQMKILINKVGLDLVNTVVNGYNKIGKNDNLGLVQMPTIWNSERGKNIKYPTLLTWSREDNHYTGCGFFYEGSREECWRSMVKATDVEDVNNIDQRLERGLRQLFESKGSWRGNRPGGVVASSLEPTFEHNWAEPPHGVRKGDTFECMLLKNPEGWTSGQPPTNGVNATFALDPVPPNNWAVSAPYSIAPPAAPEAQHRRQRAGNGGIKKKELIKYFDRKSLTKGGGNTNIAATKGKTDKGNPIIRTRGARALPTYESSKNKDGFDFSFNEPFDLSAIDIQEKITENEIKEYSLYTGGEVTDQNNAPDIEVKDCPANNSKQYIIYSTVRGSGGNFGKDGKGPKVLGRCLPLTKKQLNKIFKPLLEDSPLIDNSLSLDSRITKEELTIFGTKYSFVSGSKNDIRNFIDSGEDEFHSYPEEFKEIYDITEEDDNTLIKKLGLKKICEDFEKEISACNAGKGYTGINWLFTTCPYGSSAGGGYNPNAREGGQQQERRKYINTDSSSTTSYGLLSKIRDFNLSEFNKEISTRATTPYDYRKAVRIKIADEVAGNYRSTQGPHTNYTTGIKVPILEPIIEESFLTQNQAIPATPAGTAPTNNLRAWSGTLAGPAFGGPGGGNSQNPPSMTTDNNSRLAVNIDYNMIEGNIPGGLAANGPSIYNSGNPSASLQGGQFWNGNQVDGNLSDKLTDVIKKTNSGDVLPPPIISFGRNDNTSHPLCYITDCRDAEDRTSIAQECPLAVGRYHSNAGAAAAGMNAVTGLPIANQPGYRCDKQLYAKVMNRAAGGKRKPGARHCGGLYGLSLTTDEAAEGKITNIQNPTGMPPFRTVNIDEGGHMNRVKDAHHRLARDNRIRVILYLLKFLEEALDSKWKSKSTNNALDGWNIKLDEKNIFNKLKDWENVNKWWNYTTEYKDYEDGILGSLFSERKTGDAEPTVFDHANTQNNGTYNDPTEQDAAKCLAAFNAHLFIGSEWDGGMRDDQNRKWPQRPLEIAKEDLEIWNVVEKYLHKLYICAGIIRNRDILSKFNKEVKDLNDPDKNSILKEAVKLKNSLKEKNTKKTEDTKKNETKKKLSIDEKLKSSDNPKLWKDLLSNMYYGSFVPFEDQTFCCCKEAWGKFPDDGSKCKLVRSKCQAITHFYYDDDSAVAPYDFRAYSGDIIESDPPFKPGQSWVAEPKSGSFTSKHGEYEYFPYPVPEKSGGANQLRSTAREPYNCITSDWHSYCDEQLDYDFFDQLNPDQLISAAEEITSSKRTLSEGIAAAISNYKNVLESSSTFKGNNSIVNNCPWYENGWVSSAYSTLSINQRRPQVQYNAIDAAITATPALGASCASLIFPLNYNAQLERVDPALGPAVVAAVNWDAGALMTNAAAFGGDPRGVSRDSTHIGRGEGLPDIRGSIDEGKSLLEIYPYGESIKIANVGWAGAPGQAYMGLNPNGVAGWNYIGQFILQGMSKYNANAVALGGWRESNRANAGAAGVGGGGMAVGIGYNSCRNVLERSPRILYNTIVNEGALAPAGGTPLGAANAAHGAVAHLVNATAHWVAWWGGGPVPTGEQALEISQPYYTQIDHTNNPTVGAAGGGGLNTLSPNAIGNWTAAGSDRAIVWANADIGRGGIVNQTNLNSYDEDIIIQQSTNLLPLSHGSVRAGNLRLMAHNPVAYDDAVGYAGKYRFDNHRFESLETDEIWNVKHSIPSIFDSDRARYLIFSCGGSIVPDSDREPKDFTTEPQWLDYLSQIMNPQGLDNNFIRDIYGKYKKNASNPFKHPFYKIMRTANPEIVEVFRNEYQRSRGGYRLDSDYKEILVKKSNDLLTGGDGNNRFNWPPYPRKGISVKQIFMNTVSDSNAGRRGAAGVPDADVNNTVVDAKWQLMSNDSINYIYENLNTADSNMWAIPHFIHRWSLSKSPDELAEIAADNYDDELQAKFLQPMAAAQRLNFINEQLPIARRKHRGYGYRAPPAAPPAVPAGGGPIVDVGVYDNPCDLRDAMYMIILLSIIRRRQGTRKCGLVHYYDKNEPYIFYYPYCPSKKSKSWESRVKKCTKYRFLKEGSGDNVISKVLNKKQMQEMILESNTDLVMQFDKEKRSEMWGYYTLNSEYEREQAKETVGWPKEVVRVIPSSKKMKSVAGGDQLAGRELPNYMDHNFTDLDQLLNEEWEPPMGEKDWTNGGPGENDTTHPVPIDTRIDTRKIRKNKMHYGEYGDSIPDKTLIRMEGTTPIYHECHPTGISNVNKPAEDRVPAVGLEIEFKDPINTISKDKMKRKYYSQKHRLDNMEVTPINHLILKCELYDLVKEYDKQKYNLKELKKVKVEILGAKMEESNNYSSIVNSESSIDKKDILKPELNKPISPSPQSEPNSTYPTSTKIPPISKIPRSIKKTDSPPSLSKIKEKTRTLSKNTNRNSKPINFQELKEVQEEYNDIKEEMDNKLRLFRNYVARERSLNRMDKLNSKHNRSRKYKENEKKLRILEKRQQKFERAYRKKYKEQLDLLKIRMSQLREKEARQREQNIELRKLMDRKQQLKLESLLQKKIDEENLNKKYTDGRVSLDKIERNLPRLYKDVVDDPPIHFKDSRTRKKPRGKGKTNNKGKDKGKGKGKGKSKGKVKGKGKGDSKKKKGSDGKSKRGSSRAVSRNRTRNRNRSRSRMSDRTKSKNN